MSNNKSRLGRGLGGLISGAGASAAKKDAVESPAKGAKKKAVKAVKVASAAGGAVLEPNGLLELKLKDLVTNPYQPRREINPAQVEELAKSIASEGLLQPIVVREKDGKYELIAGERRMRAVQFLKQKTILARVIEASDASSATLALIENLQRENLNPVDEALGFASLVRDFDLTQEAAAERVGKGRATVANAMRLLTLNTEIQGYLSRRLISTGHAKVLLGLESDEHQRMLARRIIETGMSVRESEQEVRRLKNAATGGAAGSTGGRKAPSEAEVTAIRDLEKRIAEHLNSRVSLKHGAKKGKLTIEYFGNEDLERILEKLGVSGG